jgi:hypothetical protein
MNRLSDSDLEAIRERDKIASPNGPLPTHIRDRRSLLAALDLEREENKKMREAIQLCSGSCHQAISPAKEEGK